MRTLIRKLFVLMAAVAALGIPSAVWAEIVKVKGAGEITYAGFKSVADERAAIEQAKKNALTRYAAGFDSARFDLYKRVEPDLLLNIDQYIPDYVQLDLQIDKSTKRIAVVIEASVNASLVENAIQKSSASVNLSGSPSERSYITFIFVARELAARKVFDPKRTDVSINEASDRGSEQAGVSPDAQSAVHTLEKSSTVKQTVGGNTEVKAEDLTYRVTTVTEVDNAVNAVLTIGNYETVDAVDAGLDVDSFKKDYSGGDDVSPSTRTAAIKTCKDKQISYLAVANMDVGLPENDAATGLTRVYVMVTAKISDLTGRFPKTVAAIAAKPYAGLGPDAQIAKQNALNEAAKMSAGDLLDQLRLKNVK